MSAASVFAIFKKEMRSYFASPVGYVFLIAYVFISSALFFVIPGDFFRANAASMRAYFDFLPFIYLIFIPLVTMRAWSEERKSGTLELLLSMPLRETEVVIGKFLASFAFLFIALAGTLTIPISIAYLGQPDWGVIVGAYVGALVLGAACISIGLYMSSLTENQIVAAIFTFAIILLLLLIGFMPVYLGSLGWFVYFAEYISLLSHFQNILRGVLDTRDLVYYVSVVVLFLYLNVKNIEARKWR